MKRDMMDKGMAAGVTLLFLALVRAEAHPQLWQTGFIAIGMNEALLMGVKIGRDCANEKRKRESKRQLQGDITRWAEEWFNPMREVN